MNMPLSSLRFPLVAAAMAGLSACGGGGGGDSSANTPPAGFATTPPAAAATGLPLPTLQLTAAQNNEILSDLSNAYGKMAQGIAGRVLGQIVPGVSPAPGAVCSNAGSGGTVAVDNGTVNYANCAFNGYTFSGSATVTQGTGTYQLDYTSIAVTGPGGLSATLNGNTQCTVSGTTANCIATNNSGVSGNDFKWGWDTLLSNGVANGTHACGCTNTWNVTYYDFTATGGKAIVQGTNGSTAYVTRNSATSFSVRLIVNGVGQDYNLTITP